MTKDDEIASGRRLLKVIRGEKETLDTKDEDKASEQADQESAQDKEQRLQALKKLSDSLKEPQPEPSDLTSEEEHIQPSEPEEALPETDESYESYREPQVEEPVEVKPYQKQSAHYQGPKQGFFSLGRSLVGLDLGAHAIKMIEVEHKGGVCNLLSFAFIETLPPEQYATQDEYTDEVLQGTKRALSFTKQGRARVLVAAGGPKVTVRQLTIPYMSEEEFESSIKWEAKKYMPYNEDDMELDYQILNGDPESAKMDVLLAAAPREQIKQNLWILKQAQVRPIATDVNPLAVLNAYIFSGWYKAGERVIILDIGAQTTYLNVYREPGEYFVRSIPVAGEQFTTEINRQIRGGYLEAEWFKRQADVISFITDPLQKMVTEIRRTLTFYRNQTGVKEFDRLVVTGGGANLKGLVEYLDNELKIEVSIFDPLRLLRISDPLAVKTLKPFASQLATAIGLVVRGK